MSDPKFTSLHGMNQTDLDSHQTRSDNETNGYAALQDGDWTKNDYQPLQM